MSADFFRRVTCDLRKVKLEPGKYDQPGVRAYCYSVSRTWQLQVRDYLCLVDGSRSKDFVVASAQLDEEALYALRDALNMLIAEHECGDDPVRGIERALDRDLLDQQRELLRKIEDDPSAADDPSVTSRLRAIGDELSRRARDVEAAQKRVADVRAIERSAAKRVADVAHALANLAQSLEGES